MENATLADKMREVLTGIVTPPTKTSDNAEGS